MDQEDVVARGQSEGTVKRHISCNTCGWDTGHVVWTDGNYRLVACGHCRLVSLDPIPDDEESGAVFDEKYYREYYLESSEVRRAYFRKRVAALRRMGAEGMLLDIGSGPGFFLAEAVAEGFQALGVEPSAYAAEYASKVLGVSVLRGKLAEANLPEDSFDVVTFWDVIGHIRNPHEVIEEVVRVLRPGGLIVIKIPIRIKVFFSLFQVIQKGADMRGLLHVPSIIHHYTYPSIGKLLEEHGAEVVGRYRLNEVKTSARHSTVRWKHLAMRTFLIFRHALGFKDSQIIYARLKDDGTSPEVKEVHL